MLILHREANLTLFGLGGGGRFGPPSRTFFNNFWNTYSFEMKFFQYVSFSLFDIYCQNFVTIWWRHHVIMTSSKYSQFLTYALRNFYSLTSFDLKLCQLWCLGKLYRNWVGSFGDLSWLCILQTRVKVRKNNILIVQGIQ